MRSHGPARSVEEVMGRLFEEPRRKQTRLPQQRPGRSRASRAVQAARGTPAAFFKNIRGAGTTSRAGLNGQMEYILNPDKVTYSFDSQCRFDRAGTRRGQGKSSAKL